MRKVIFALTLLLTTTGCADLLVDNTNDPDRERALSEPADVQSLLQGATSDLISGMTGRPGAHIGLWADQATSTNNFISLWAFSDEGRRRYNNRTTNPDLGVTSVPWNSFNSTISSANTVLALIETDGLEIVINGVDETERTRAAAYFARGVARGYLGMMYNEAYLVDIDTDLSNLETVPYSELIAGGVSDLETALDIADGVSGFTYTFVPGANSYSKAAFIEIANSMAARFLISEPRTQAEAAGFSNDRWNTIINYARNGVGTAIPSFSPASVSAEFWYDYGRWNTFHVTGPVVDDPTNATQGAAYIPTDLKVIHLLDPSYPVEYPASGSLPQASSDDPRLGYYGYTPNFGFLNASRRRSIFSNYFSLRLQADDNDWAFLSGAPIPVVTRSEMQYIIAEANFWLGNKSGVAAALANSPYGTVPTRLEYPLPAKGLGFFSDAPFPGGADGYAAGKTLATSASDAQIVRDLHTEYSVELDMLGGIGIQWFFMRRHDLLQAGTPLHFPIPGDELEVTNSEYYTFGGVDFASEEGTATGANSWKTFDQRNAGQLRSGSDNLVASARQQRRFSGVRMTPSRTRKPNN